MADMITTTLVQPLTLVQPFQTNGPKWGDAGVGTPGGNVTWSLASFNFSDRLSFSSTLGSFMPSGFEAEIQRAFDAWSAVADISFTQVADSADANIRLGGNAIDGPTVPGGGASTLGIAHSTFTGSSFLFVDIEFDSAENWTVDTSGVSVFSVVTHEVGHGLGLAHEDSATAIMNTLSDNLQSLQADDIAGIQFIYGATDDVGEDTSTSGSVAVGANASGNIEFAGDTDWFAISLIAGRPYQFDLTGTTLNDPLLRLYDSSGAVITSDDNSGSGTAAQIAFTATSTGTHFLSAEGASTSETGTYSLAAAFNVTDVANGIYRFFNTQTGAHFYTASDDERDSVLANLAQFSFEGAVFKTASTSESQQSDVFRFLNNDTGTHFFTISTEERDNIIATLSQFTFEGAAYQAFQQEVSGSTPLFRFFNTDTGTHFYTVDADERDNVIATLPQFTFEGTAYFVEGLG